MDDGTATPCVAKACTGCSVVKPLDDYTFDKRHADGHQSRCKACFNAYKKRYREADREHYLKLKQLEYERNRAQYRAQAAAYREANRDLLNQRAKDSIASLTEEDLEDFRQRRRATSAAYLLRNREACNARIRAWSRANPDKRVDMENRRRARKLGNGDSEKISRREIGERDGWVCGICEQSIDASLRWPDHRSQSLDHILPLVHGGTHTRVNVRITHLICNVRRGAGRKRPDPLGAIESAA
jgi:hypothetical protein